MIYLIELSSIAEGSLSGVLLESIVIFPRKITSKINANTEVL